MYMNKSMHREQWSECVLLDRYIILACKHVADYTMQNGAFCLSISTSEHTSRFKVSLWKSRNENGFTIYTTVHYMIVLHENKPPCIMLCVLAPLSRRSVPRRDLSHIRITIRIYKFRIGIDYIVLTWIWNVSKDTRLYSCMIQSLQRWSSTKQ